MKIVADANIPLVEEAFGQLGQVTLLPGREIGPEQVRDADVLIVRSVTSVGPALLEGSRVRFVGSATIGLDHVDEVFLNRRGIAFAYAPGSNANSVAEYVIAALLALGRERYEGRTLGLIGVGRIGTLVQEKALALGMTVLANDPPLERAGRAGLVSLDALLRGSDLVSCHVPLTREGPDATFHLLDEARLSLLQSHAVVINTARGPVVDNAALLRALRGGRIGGAVLDVWEHEPEPDPELIEAVTLGTPHIAGYSFDGKVNGTRMLYDAVCAFLEPARERSFPTVPSERNAPPVEI
ncbi:MAG TPA: 4-phosphoerythronate dehydrogenase, partial [Nitrospirales bacterium]|nr:4-phosphoerythronate dehydrogenase [Nitrospirales bacterium]